MSLSDTMSDVCQMENGSSSEMLTSSLGVADAESLLSASMSFLTRLRDDGRGGGRQGDERERRSNDLPRHDATSTELPVGLNNQPWSVKSAVPRDGLEADVRGWVV